MILNSVLEAAGSSELDRGFFRFSKLHSFALPATSSLPSSKLLCLHRWAPKHGRTSILGRLLWHSTWLCEGPSIACWVILHLLHLLVHACVLVGLEVSTGHAHLGVIHSPCTHPLLGQFFLHALGLLLGLGLPDLLLALEDALVCGVHLEVRLQLRHLDRLTVSKCDDIIE